jgi:hypothetical protein
MLREKKTEGKIPLCTNRLRIGELGKCLYKEYIDFPNPRRGLLGGGE